MHRIATVVLAGACLVPGLLVGESTSRFVVETHAIGTAGRQEPMPVTFKLDTATGDVWRFTGVEFQQLPVVLAASAGLGNRVTPVLEAQRRRAAIQRKLDTIVIPEIDFKQVSLRAAVEFLGDASRKYDPDKEGVNLVLAVRSTRGEAQAADPLVPGAVLDPFSAAANTGDPDPYPPITFSAKRVSLRDTLDILVQLADVRCRIQGHGVVIVDNLGCGETFAFRMYDLPPKAVDLLRDQDPTLFEKNVPEAVMQDRWKRFFGGQGVGWSEYSLIRYAPIMGKVIVRNRFEDLGKFEQILRGINTFPLRPGRFRLVPLVDPIQARPALLLLDSDTGRTWYYEVGELDAATAAILADEFVDVSSRTTTGD